MEAGAGAELRDVERRMVFRLSQTEGSCGVCFVMRCVFEASASLEGSCNDPCVCCVNISLLGAPAEAQ